jgi:hypothetical protein
MARPKLILGTLGVLLMAFIGGVLGGAFTQSVSLPVPTAHADFSGGGGGHANPLADDSTIGYGGSSDTLLGWETADASDHYFNINVTGSSDLVVSQDANVDWGIAGANRLRVQSADSAAPAEYISLAHDGTQAIIDSNSGDLNLDASTGFVLIPGSTGAGTQRFFIRSSATGIAGFELGEATSSTVFFRHFANLEQASLTLADGAGNHLVIGNSASASDDYDHATQTDPTLFIHSDTDPDSANDEWISFAHNQTDGVIALGSGTLTLPENAIDADESAVMHDWFVACGDLGNATTIYMGPGSDVGLTRTGPFAGGATDTTLNSAACDNYDNATEATADFGLYGMRNVSFKVTGMSCVVSIEPTADVVFTVRSAEADLTPSVSCTIAAAGTVDSCSTTTASTTDVAAGATVAVKAVTTSDESSTNANCKVFIAYK